MLFLEQTKCNAVWVCGQYLAGHVEGESVKRRLCVSTYLTVVVCHHVSSCPQSKKEECIGALTRLVHIRAPSQEHSYQSVGILDADSDHQWCPAAVVLR